MARPRPFQTIFRPSLRALDVQVETWALPAIANATGLHSAIDVSGAASNHALTVSSDYCRNVTIQTVDAAGNNLAGTVIVTGTNIRGETQTESFSVIANTDDYVGNKAFSTVTNIAWNFGVTKAADDTLALGFGNKLGLAKPADTILKETFNGANRAVGTLNKTYNTYVSGATLDGAKAVELIYRVRY